MQQQSDEVSGRCRMVAWMRGKGNTAGLQEDSGNALIASLSILHPSNRVDEADNPQVLDAEQECGAS